MSSSRSISAARQRRAGEAPPVGQRGPGTSINSQQAFAQQQQQQQNVKYQKQQPNQLPPQAPQVPVGKLSVGDAFALVTIRLGRIETIIQKLEAEGVIGPNAHSNPGVMEHDENARIVDDTVIRNIINRIGDLEKGQQKIAQQQQAAPAEEIIKAATDDLHSQTSDLQTQANMLSDQVVQLKNELRDTKEMLMKLQSFSMETNQKIISIVLTQESLLKVSETKPDPKTETDVDDEVEEEVEVAPAPNLKQIIEDELNAGGEEESS